MEELTDAATAREVADRDWWKCIRCGIGLVAGPRSAHHRVLGNRADRRMVNLILLCGSGTTGCHGWVHAHPRLAKDAAGWIVSRHADPATAPVYYNQPGRTGWKLLAGDRVDDAPDAGPPPPPECLPEAA